MSCSPLEYHPLIAVVGNVFSTQQSSLFPSDLRSVSFLWSLLSKSLEHCITNGNFLSLRKIRFAQKGRRVSLEVEKTQFCR